MLSQPKRVALLAYLAAATPRGLHSRDRLVALFSPEQDQRHARQALRQALSVLRGELGTAAIVTVGDDEVGLDFSAVWCDVVAFNEAVAAGQHAEAVELYRGGFLEAFYVRDATPEFEQWIDTVRDGLKRDFSACVRTLVDRCRASGNLNAATIWARRAHQLAPDDEVLLRSLIDLLDQAGNRASALQVYEEFAAMLKREYASEPAPETRELIERVRRRAVVVPSQPRVTDHPAAPPSGPPAPIRPVKGHDAGDYDPTTVLRAAALVAGVLIAAVLAIRLWPRIGPSCIQVDRFTVQDVATPPWLEDSLAYRVADQLSGFPDFVSRSTGKRCPWRSRVVVHAVGSASVDRSQLVVEARVVGEAPVVARGAVVAWRTLGDSVAGGLAVQILRSHDPSLPAGALPRTPDGVQAFLRAEKLFAEGRWAEAGLGYVHAEAVDTTCYLCSWRMNELGRWLRANPDPAPKYADHIEAFPAHYQRLIRSTLVPLRAGLDTLMVGTLESPYFFLGLFRLGDEMFHRGPLVGHARAEAIEAFHETINLRPDFAPAWEHLAWAMALEGDSAGAYQALDHLKRLRPRDDLYALAADAMVSVGVAWRFAPPAQAMKLTTRYVTDPALRALDVLPAGPRYVLTFGAPRGAVEFGRYFADDFAHLYKRPDLIPSALLAEVFGYIALGQGDSARHAARQLADRALTPELGLFVHELDAALLMLDAGSGALMERWPELAKALAQFVEMHSATDGVHRRAAWALTLAGRQVGGQTVDRFASLLDHEPNPQPLRRLLIADALARSGHLREALAVSDPLIELAASSLAAHEPDAPFFRTMLHLLRADWHRRLGNSHDARAELLWYQNLDDRGWLIRSPQMAEADWAFATLAQWRLARLLDLEHESSAACRAYGEVVRLWSGGEPNYKARADTARARQAELGCA